MVCLKLEEDDEEESEEIPEANDQEGAEFGWFNDLFVLDTGECWTEI